MNVIVIIFPFHHVFVLDKRLINSVNMQSYISSYPAYEEFESQ